MAKKSNKTRRTRGLSLIEFLNLATASDQKMSSGAVKEQKDQIKRLARSNNWQREFSRELDKNPNWVQLAKEGVKFFIAENGTVKGAFPIVRNNIALIKVVM